MPLLLHPLPTHVIYIILHTHPPRLFTPIFPSMASHFQLLLFLFLLTNINHLSTSQTTLDLTKDAQTQQYTTHLLIGTPPLPTNLILHLSGHSLFLNCAKSPSSSRQLLPHNSLPCSMAKSVTHPPSPHTTCNLPQLNPITGSENSGDLAEDIVTIVNGLTPSLTVDRFLFSCSCSPEHLLKGLPTNAKGILGFGRSKIAFQSQLLNNFDISRVFTLCLSSSDGFIISGSRISNSLSYTPLISINGHDDVGYYVSVKSMKINGRRLGGLQQQQEQHNRGGVEISTVVQYTTMRTPIYEIFVKGYVKAASLMNMTMVDPVAPFGVCFRKEKKVPEVELVLQSELVKWRIERRNLMVEVSGGVMCLGFVDGGLEMSGSMVLGGFQLEDRVMEFNLGTGMMGFGNSGNSCSEMKRGLGLVSTPTESL